MMAAVATAPHQQEASTLQDGGILMADGHRPRQPDRAHEGGTGCDPTGAATYHRPATKAAPRSTPISSEWTRVSVPK